MFDGQILSYKNKVEHSYRYISERFPRKKADIEK